MESAISQNKLTTRNKIKICLIILVIGCAVWYWWEPLLEILRMISDKEVVANYIKRYDPWGPIVLFLLLVLQVFLSFIPGHALIVAGGYVYGFGVGILITLTSTVAASQLAYLLTRKYGRPFVEQMIPETSITRWDDLIQNHGGIFFFFAFILPIFPADFMPFIAGLSSISPQHFFWANFFGRLLVAIFITLIGSHGLIFPPYFWVLGFVILLTLSVSWKKVSSGIKNLH